LRTDHVKLESPSILTKNSFLPGHWGGGLPPLVYASAYEGIVNCVRAGHHLRLRTAEERDDRG